MSTGWNWFFAWVTLLAFVLAIPMAVAANVLTPKVQNWWATTSDARRRKRIEKLSTELKTLHGFAHDEEIEALSKVLKFFGLIGVLFISACASAFISLFSLVSVQRLRAIIQQPSGPLKGLDSITTTMVVSAMLCFFFMYISLLIFFFGIFLEARKLSPQIRDKRMKGLVAKIEILGGTVDLYIKQRLGLI